MAQQATNTKTIQTLKTPRIGQPWPGQGGIYAGIIRDGDRQWHLILAVTPESKISAEWGGYGEEEPNAQSYVDGKANTFALIASAHAHPAAQKVASLIIDEHTDFYLPAQKENNLIYINLPEHLDKKWHWSSTQYSASCAWVQDFVDGHQVINDKDDSYAVRAVRRLPIE
jgi:hypothetical protein